MKNSILKSLTAILLAAFLGGCLYTDVQRPLDDDYLNTELGAKVGRASNHSIMWLVAWGDAGSKAAAEEGGLKVIRHADTEFFSVLFGLYTRTTTIVYGD